MKKLFFLSLLAFGTLILNAEAPRASALSGSEFQAGRIIDDSVFFNPHTIDVAGIQAFLNSKVPVCDTWHSSSNPNYQPPFTCLKEFRQDTPTKAAETALCKQYNGGNKSSAQIIYDVAQACGINPKALIVLLEKEQSLVTDSWPWSIQYRSATGYGCPDTAPCDEEYYGFFNQVYNAARQFKRYSRDESSFRYRTGRVNYIQYNPNTGCGGTNVFIQNQATAGLYNFTPYQPNPSALANLYGSGDPCGAYGNRNFWRLFRDWFGPTYGHDSLHTLNFVRINHYAGSAGVVSTPSVGLYSYISKNIQSPYPSVPPDGAVVPLLWPANGDLVFIRLNHYSGNVGIVSYDNSWNFQRLANNTTAGYPAVETDGSVVPLFWPGNGDLVFIRLNHYSGNVGIVSYNASSNYKQTANNTTASYPSVPVDGSVVPLFWPGNGDLVFIKLNHYSGKVGLASYSASSNYKQLANHTTVGHPAVPADGSVLPMFRNNGDLSFVKLNHPSGNVEVSTYSASSNYQDLIDYRLTAYPSVETDGSVVPLMGP